MLFGCGWAGHEAVTIEEKKTCKKICLIHFDRFPLPLPSTKNPWVIIFWCSCCCCCCWLLFPHLAVDNIVVVGRKMPGDQSGTFPRVFNFLFLFFPPARVPLFGWGQNHFTLSFFPRPLSQLLISCVISSKDHRFSSLSAFLTLFLFLYNAHTHTHRDQDLSQPGENHAGKYFCSVL